MPTQQRIAHAALAAATAVLVLVTAVSGYVRWELADANAFAARTASTLDDDAVRAVISERVADGVASVRPDVLTARPIVLRATDAAVATPAFLRLFERSVRDAHDLLVNGRGNVVVELERGGVLLVNALRRVSPRVARQVPTRIEPRLTRLSGAALEVGAIRRASDLAGAFWVLFALTILAGAGCAATATGLRSALVTVAGCVAAAGAALPVLIGLLGAVVVPRAARAADLEEGDEQAAIQALWNALLADLRTAGLIAAVAGTIVAVVASGGVPAPAAIRQMRRAARLRPLRGAALIALGVALALAPAGTLTVAAWVASTALVLVGAAELSAAKPRRVSARSDRPGRPPLAGVLLAGAATALALIALALVLPAPNPAPASTSVADTCNGSRSLCDRRIDQVVFPATHNSYSAATQPGWFLTNQRFGIERQLRDGIRALLIDVHPGVRDPETGRVRTDLRAEESTRNKVADQLSPEALRLADRVAGGVGLGKKIQGERGAYLCHALCEIGAEPLTDELGVVARFLATNPGEVVVLFVEPYVGVGEIEEAMAQHDLVRQAARLDPGAELPTLRDLVRADTRLVVLAEEDGGERDWYLPGFDLVQDTPLTDRGADERSCARARGRPGSPLLLINHWADAYPPTARRNERIGGEVLAERLERCERRRRSVPNLPAVDFYERSGVVEIARDLNSRPR